MKIAIGCDPNATEFKTVLIPYIESLGHETVDFGSDDPIYADTAIKLAEAYKVEMPITEAVNAVVNGGASAKDQVHALMHREQKPEIIL